MYVDCLLEQLNYLSLLCDTFCTIFNSLNVTSWLANIELSRDIHLYESQDGDSLIGFLTISNASKVDQGTFRCEVITVIDQEMHFNFFVPLSYALLNLAVFARNE
jgi:hypothetical protein